MGLPSVNPSANQNAHSSTNPGASDLAASGPAAPEQAAMSREKQRVALLSMAAAGVMTLLKLAAGLLSGSLGVLSDAAHSGLDLLAAGLTYFSVQVSDKPADEVHTYGHGKIENLSSFSEVLLMMASSAWIIWEAIRRIFFHAVELHNAAWPAVVVVCSIGVDFWRSRELRAVARRTGSPALATDAFHFASDIWSSCAVLAGLAATWIGTRFGVGWLRYADPAAAIVVSVLILRLTLYIGRDAVGALMDEIPAGTRRRLVREVEKVDGIMSVPQARLRRSGASHFVDLTIALPRRSTFAHTGEMVQAATQAVQMVLPRADVVVHTVPHASRAESLFDRVRAVAAGHNVSVHDLSVQLHQGRLRVEQHVELDEKLELREAHAFVTAMEGDILRAVPEIDSILTHIESEPATIERPEVISEANRRIELALREAAESQPDILDVHEIAVGRSAEHLSLSCHCTLPDNLLMHQVHEAITGLEDRFKLLCPEVQRVTIHPEPSTDNRR
jgi:cation diffusion facilitator family transporter